MVPLYEDVEIRLGISHNFLQDPYDFRIFFDSEVPQVPRSCGNRSGRPLTPAVQMNLGLELWVFEGPLLIVLPCNNLTFCLANLACCVAASR
jgi:hypothetical protein